MAAELIRVDDQIYLLSNLVKVEYDVDTGGEPRLTLLTRPVQGRHPRSDTYSGLQARRIWAWLCAQCLVDLSADGEATDADLG